MELSHCRLCQKEWESEEFIDDGAAVFYCDPCSYWTVITDHIENEEIFIAEFDDDYYLMVIFSFKLVVKTFS